MSEQTVFTFAKWSVKKGEADNVLRLLAEVAVETANEKGNLSYHAHVNISDPDTILLMESYVDQQAVEAHRASEHFQKIVLAQIVPLLESREVILAKRVELIK